MATSSLYDLQSLSKNMSPLNFTASTAAAATGATTATAAVKATDTALTADTTTSDHVSLSEEAKQLYEQGQTTTTIASSLSTDKKTVESYLSISANSTLQKTLLATLTAALK